MRVSDVNDNAPRFMNTPYEVTVPEVSLAIITCCLKYKFFRFVVAYSTLISNFIQIHMKEKSLHCLLEHLNIVSTFLQ